MISNKIKSKSNLWTNSTIHIPRLLSSELEVEIGRARRRDNDAYEPMKGVYRTVLTGFHNFITH